MQDVLSVVIALLGLVAVYGLVLGIRWVQVRNAASRAVAQLESELVMARNCRGEQYGIRFQNPGLMFQIIEEVENLLLSLQGSLILMSLMPTRKRASWKATKGYTDVVNRAELGVKALSDAAFFAQFPEGSQFCQNVCINGIPIRER